MAKKKVEGNKCQCDKTFAQNHVSAPCDKEDCVKCYSCCGPGCAACIILCTEKEKCRCSACGCKCQENCDVRGGKKRCVDSDCPKCKTKCKDVQVGGRCRCYLCNCGCNGVNCQCCRRCNPQTSCTSKCDTEEIHDENNCPKGKCKEKPGTCNTVRCMCQDKGIVKRDDLCVCYCKCEQLCPRILCDKTRGGESTSKPGLCGKKSKDECSCKCTCNCNAYGKFYCKKHKSNSEGCNISDCDIIFYGIGKCRFPCTNCGRVCDQDRCMIWIRVIVIGLIILASLFVMRAIFPEKFHAIMTKIRATFVSVPVHSGRSLNNLVGDTIPEETNIDRYPAFRPRAYAGLA